jgi:hypothetical protein
MILCPGAHPDFPDHWILVKQSEHDDQCGYLLSHMTSELYYSSSDN